MKPSYSWSQLKSDVGEDIAIYLDYADEYNPGSRSLSRKLSALLMPSVFACLIYRISHWYYCRKLLFIAMFFSRLNMLITGVSITPASEIGGGFI